MNAQADIGLIGLAVMGQNLVLNMNDHGFTVAVNNRTTSKIDEFLAGEAKGRAIIGAYTLEELVAVLKRPRKIMIMVKAGRAVDGVIDQLVPLLEPGDIIIDGGNSHFPDSTRREQELAKHDILFVGSGVSGGEEGARFGPSIMPGGASAAWPHLQPIFQAISAKAEDGAPCADWLGPEGSGHFVKMVHNGIEYGDMQLIAEAYDLMSNGLGMTPDEMSEVFARWNQGKLSSYLIEITADILAYKDEDGAPLIDMILDTAGQKGTGKWTVSAALDMGTPLTLIGEAVFSRFLSARKDQRVEAAAVLGESVGRYTGDRAAFVEDIGAALYASKIASYAQGYMLFRAAAEEFGWPLAYATIARIWREGCIIRAGFLNDITAAYEADPDLPNLLLAPYFRDAVLDAQDAWRRVVAAGAQLGIET